MNKKQLRAFLDWRMCSDPWPGCDMQVVDEWLDGISRKFGFAHWVDAYHGLRAPNAIELTGRGSEAPEGPR